MTDLKKSGIYEIRCTVTSKVYIGSAVKLCVRWTRHQYHLNRGSHHSEKLQRAWDKHGKDSFVFSVLEIVEDARNILVCEQKYLDTLVGVESYNICLVAGSVLGRVHKESTKQKISVGNKGKKRTQEMKDHHSVKMSGRKHTEAALENLRAAAKRRVGVKDSDAARLNKAAASKLRGMPRAVIEAARMVNLGRKDSEETRKNKSDAQKRRGYIMSEDNKAKLIAVHKGCKRSEESKLKMSIAQKARFAREKLEKEAKLNLLKGEVNK